MATQESNLQSEQSLEEQRSKLPLRRVLGYVAVAGAVVVSGVTLHTLSDATRQGVNVSSIEEWAGIRHAESQEESNVVHAPQISYRNLGEIAPKAPIQPSHELDVMNPLNN